MGVRCLRGGARRGCAERDGGYGVSAPFCRCCGSALNGDPRIEVEVRLHGNGQKVTIATLLVHAHCYAAMGLGALMPARPS